MGITIEEPTVIELSAEEAAVYLDLVRRLVAYDQQGYGLRAADVNRHAVSVLGSHGAAGAALQGLVDKRLLLLSSECEGKWKWADYLAPIRYRDVDVRVDGRRVWPETPDGIAEVLRGVGSFEEMQPDELAAVAEIVLILATSRHTTVQAARRIVRDLANAADPNRALERLGKR